MIGFKFDFQKEKIFEIKNLQDFPAGLFSPYLKGIFETILVLRGKPVLLERHLNRLYTSARYFSIPLPEEGAVKKLVTKEASTLKLEKGALRLTVQLNEPFNETYILVSKKEYPYREEMFLKGRSACFSMWKRDSDNPLYRHKIVQQIENKIAREFAEVSGYDDCLFVNLKGNVTEATSANIFVFKDGFLKTPQESEGVLKGITRDVVVELCNSSGEIEVKEAPVSTDELVSAEEVFLTNSLMGLMPVISIERREIGSGVVGSLTKKLSKQVWNHFLKDIR